MRRQLEAAIAERDEARAQQAALAEVLRAINAANGDFAPVFDLITEKVLALCDAPRGALITYDGTFAVAVSQRNLSTAFAKFWETPQRLEPTSHIFQLLRERATVQVADLAASEAYRNRVPSAVAAVEIESIRTIAWVPLVNERGAIGLFVIYRQEVRPFTDRQIAVAEAFAAQTVIALENARLIGETRAALEQQNASGEVLQLINSSSGDLKSVLDAITDKAIALCDAAGGELVTIDGELATAVSLRNARPGLVEFWKNPQRIAGSTLDRMRREQKTFHHPDMAEGEGYRNRLPLSVAGVELGGIRTFLQVPLINDRGLLGLFMIFRQEVLPFTEKQIAVVEAFAVQAVIAMENARLLTEQREALEQQTATAEVLEVINASPGDLAPVFGTMLEKAMHLCEAAFGVFGVYDGKIMTPTAYRGVDDQTLADVGGPFEPSAGGPMFQSLRVGSVVTLPDLRDTDGYREGLSSVRALADRGGARTVVWVPLRKDDRSIGIMVLYRQEVRAFSDKQVALLQNFAAQAVIAMENARLLTEQREALEQQTATADILRVISQSPTDVQPVLDAVADSARLLCGSDHVHVHMKDGNELVTRASASAPQAAGTLSELRIPIDRRSAAGRAVLEGRTVHLPNVMSLDATEYGKAQELAKVGGFGTLLSAPMIRDGAAVGVITLPKTSVEPFTPRQIALLETFAAQAVIAIENVRLFTELKESLDQQTATADILRVISQSPTDVRPVLDAVVKAAVRFCGAEDAIVALRDGDGWQGVAHEGPMGAPIKRNLPVDRSTAPGQSMAERRTIQFPDIEELDPVDRAHELEAARRMGFRAVASAPMLRDQTAIGAVALRRKEPGAFTARQLELLESFAAQAVIAIENVRLFTELKESLDQQTATADILRVINASQGDVTPVFQAILEKAHSVCRADMGSLFLRDGDNIRAVTTMGYDEEIDAILRQSRPPMPAMVALIEGQRFHHLADLKDDTGGSAQAFGQQFRSGSRIRTNLIIPLRKDSTVLGFISANRREVRPYSDKEIGLIESFAAQAVIAMENARLLGELRESLEQQTATSDILRVISQSPTDVQPVLDVVVKAAQRFCGADDVVISLRDGDELTIAAHDGPIEAPPPRRKLDRSSAQGRAVIDATTIHLPDIAQLDPVEWSAVIALSQRFGAKASLAAPMLREGTAVGAIMLRRREAGPFTERQMALLEAFAAQAVIAIENVRLFTELRQRTDDLAESLDYQTATSEVLSVISRSPADLQPVLEAMTAAAVRLCGVKTGGLSVRRGNTLQFVALVGQTPEFERWQMSAPLPIERGILIADAVLDKEPVQVVDVMETDAYKAGAEVERAVVDLGGHRTILHVPLLRDSEAVGVLTVSRSEPEAFTEQQIGLIKTFADQAVIAMENARLLGELTRREEELRVTFDHMGDGVAMFDAGLRLASWNRHFQELLDIPDSFVATRPGLEDYVRLLVQRGEVGHDNPDEEIARYRDRANTAWTAERTRPDGRVIEVRNNPVPGGGAVLIYSDITERKKAEATIAAARDEAEAALERQTATADILKVIASSPTDVRPVLDVLAKAAVRFCGATDAAIHMRDGNDSMVVAHEGPLPLGPTQSSPTPLNRETGFGIAILDCVTIHRPDVQALDPIKFAAAHAFARELGFRAVLVVPLRRDGTAIGAISLRRAQVGAFSPQQIELLETFAAQAVIAIENVRLFTELRDSLDRLKAAQANLVQSEKMASLGQLTAGIAHEIKNPLNFVNNFATLSVDLLGELKQVAGPALATLDGDARAEVDETMELLVGNLGKIAEHGKRADGIVKSMLSHSRGGAGDWAPSDINALVEEALNLAYHGARSQDKDFNVTLERDLEKTGTPIEVVPQDVTRVFLNLFGNGFYAANKRRLSAKQPGFRPTLRVTTRDLVDRVEVKVRDNGIGMPPEVKEKLFQPFFTTKPTGEGTGLGLSISYDIVTQQHGGTIDVESEPNNYTEFTVRLPRARRVAEAARGA